MIYFNMFPDELLEDSNLEKVKRNIAELTGVARSIISRLWNHFQDIRKLKTSSRLFM